MNTQELETRVANLETIVAELQQKINVNSEQEIPWWKQIRGAAANDEMFDEAVRLGREYRESLRPKNEDEE